MLLLKRESLADLAIIVKQEDTIYAQIENFAQLLLFMAS